VSFDLFEARCPKDGKLLGRISGVAELFCARCKTKYQILPKVIEPHGEISFEILSVSERLETGVRLCEIQGKN